MLKPGDTLVSIVDHATSWKTALVIAIDRGCTPTEHPDWEKRGWRPASVLLLVNSMQLLTRDFTWISRNFKHVEDVP